MKTIEENRILAREYKYDLHAFHKKGHDRYLLPIELNKLKRHELMMLYFLSIENPLELCKFLKKNFSELEKLINNPIYKHYSIPKKSGGKREIYDPEEALKDIQKNLNFSLQVYYLSVKPKGIYGFTLNLPRRKGFCNIVANAKQHVGKPHVLNIDIKNFFPSIKANKVKALFMSSYFKYNEQIATALTLLTTYQGKLPAGSPISPVISNFICLPLDEQMISFCRKNRIKYTRYADDLTFSSKKRFSDDLIAELKGIIQQQGFEVNKKKLRVKANHQKQTVTGLIVNEKVNVDRKLLKKVRAMHHDYTKNGVKVAAQRHFEM